MSKDRLKTIVYNLITYLETDLIGDLPLDQKVQLLKDEIGFTEEELEELEITKNCLS